MITLCKFGPHFGLPDASAFCVKAEILLKMAGLKYEVDLDSFKNAPKGKLPYINDGGKTVGDSTFIRLHIEEKYGFDFNAGLDARAAGIAWSAEKMCEDHLYWVILNDRWKNDENFDLGPRIFFQAAPALIRPIITRSVRKQIVKGIKTHGLGRHSDAEIYTLAGRAITALADILGDNEYFMGDKICGVDATVFAFIDAISAAHFNSPMIALVEGHKNLAAYRDRMRAEWFPE
ncbi:MAG: glutathione S-transferase family protein [Rhizobiales bacterium]|nr:glutathione S-transferase family protein [Hyphomicrobiales bacterium]